MEAVLEALSRSRHARVAVEAVPGAGKTHLLLRACRGRRALLLAYNAQLAAEVEAALARDPDNQSTCVTFHALCGKCLAPARDDAQLEDAVMRAERGELVAQNVPPVDLVLVDEAQDVRTLYVRLLNALGLVRCDVSLVVAGDRHQLVYDFDDEFPATLDTLLHPGAAMGGVWERAVLNTSHRLTAQMATLVNSVFGSKIEATRDGPPVEVRAPKSAFALHQALRDLFEEKGGGLGDTLLLVDRKRGNRPLRVLLNALSRDGHALHVHGVDDEHAPSNAIRCATFWSAKGLECDTAIVLLPACAPHNPTYVALTRARRRLVVVLDPREPHAAVSAAVLQDPNAYYIGGATAYRAVEAGASQDVQRSLARATFESRPGALCNLDRWEPRRTAMRNRISTRIIHNPDVQEDPPLVVAGRAHDVGAVALQTALVIVEHLATGRVRAFEDVLHPTRLDRDKADHAVRAGFTGRWVPRFVSDDDLLADDLRAQAKSAYLARPFTPARAAVVALAILSWDGFDHVMRQMLPVSEWTHHPAIQRAVDFALEFLPSRREVVEYDVRISRSDAHVRVHAVTPSECYHVVWNKSSSDEAAAAVRAAAHPQRRCHLVDLWDGTVTVVECSAELWKESQTV